MLRIRLGNGRTARVSFTTAWMQAVISGQDVVVITDGGREIPFTADELSAL